MPTNLKELEDRLWAAADQLHANSPLKSAEYSEPVLGLIFLRFADVRFVQAEAELQTKFAGRRRGITREDYQEKSILYLPEKSRWSFLIVRPEGEDLGKTLNDAMSAIEADNPDLRGVLPKKYNAFDSSLLVELLKIFNNIPKDLEGDAFGKIYEYFLGKFAMSEGQKGGEFFTPTSIVKLIVEIIQPYEGKIYDPACGSGGMFVQSAEFVARHKGGTLSIYGQERVEETIRLCKMNLAVHGLGGSILKGNSYYEDLFSAVGQFNYVMANPPFNVSGVNKDDLAKRTDRFPFGMPKNDIANYIWIQMFYSSLAANGRAGFVMANSASDARGSELEIRKKLIQSGAVDVIVTVGSNMFYTVTLPCTLWFLDRSKTSTPRRDKILFIDARAIYTQLDRAHREWNQNQLELIAVLARLYRGDDLNGYVFDPTSFPNLTEAQVASIRTALQNGAYSDIPGLCKVANQTGVETQGWSLNSGRYVEVAEKNAETIDFATQLEALNEELEVLNTEARELEEEIAENITSILG